MGIEQCAVVELPKVAEPRGNLTFLEAQRHVPFEIRRVFYLYDVPAGALRGGHSHWKQHQFLIALGGAFNVRIDDGAAQKIVRLDAPWKGLHIPPMIWATEEEFEPGAVCLVLASAAYDESDYCRDYDRFRRAVLTASDEKP